MIELVDYNENMLGGKEAAKAKTTRRGRKPGKKKEEEVTSSYGRYCGRTREEKQENLRPGSQRPQLLQKLKKPRKPQNLLKPKGTLKPAMPNPENRKPKKIKKKKKPDPFIT